jgi:hypothetical protein
MEEFEIMIHFHVVKQSNYIHLYDNDWNGDKPLLNTLVHHHCNIC